MKELDREKEEKEQEEQQRHGQTNWNSIQIAFIGQALAHYGIGPKKTEILVRDERPKPKKTREV